MVDWKSSLVFQAWGSGEGNLDLVVSLAPTCRFLVPTWMLWDTGAGVRGMCSLGP